MVRLGVAFTNGVFTNWATTGNVQPRNRRKREPGVLLVGLSAFHVGLAPGRLRKFYRSRNEGDRLPFWI
jgi:hypothetical protein